MTCPLCKLDLRITKSWNKVVNDDTPDIPTKLYVVQELSCRNENCPNCDKVLDTKETELPIG